MLWQMVKPKSLSWLFLFHNSHRVSRASKYAQAPKANIAKARIDLSLEWVLKVNEELRHRLKHVSMTLTSEWQWKPIGMIGHEPDNKRTIYMQKLNHKLPNLRQEWHDKFCLSEWKRPIWERASTPNLTAAKSGQKLVFGRSHTVSQREALKKWYFSGKFPK